MDLSAARRALLLVLCLGAPLASPASAQPAFQVADVNPSTEAFTNPLFLSDSIAAVGSTVYLSADDGPGGLELWKSGGTSINTVRIKDICPGSCWSRPRNLTVSAGRVFFTADDGAHGRELWVTDGTAAGTRLVKDIRPGLGSGLDGGPTLVDLGGTVFFRADDGEHGAELWKSDGTEAGTELVADIVAGPDSSFPVVRVASSTRLFFLADDGVHGREPWISDGTAAGTAMIEDVAPGADGSVFPFTFTGFAREWLATSGGKLVFLADDGVHGPEPWVSDGTAAGTDLLADLLAGADGSFPQSFTEMGGSVYFSANGGMGGGTGWELWKTGGVPGDPAQVKEIRADGNAGPFELTAVGSLLFFRAHDGTHGVELWKSDGTEAGTQLVKDIVPGPDGAFFPGSLYGFSDLGGELLFAAFDGTGFELWRSDGTPAGTFQVTALQPHVVPSFVGADTGFVVAGFRLYYRAFEVPTGLELYHSDGTAAGTERVRDFGDPTDSLFLFNGGLAAGPGSFVSRQGELLFQATDGATGYELWQSDVAVPGAPGAQQLVDAAPGPDSSLPSQLVHLGGTTLFTAAEALWTTDGTPAGTAQVGSGPATNGSGLTRFGDRVYFSRAEEGVGHELWRTDGTEAGTEQVLDIHPGEGSSSPTQLTVSGGRLFFTAASAAAPSGVPDTELWLTDGTDGGTILVRDVEPGVEGSHPQRLTDAGGILFFFAETAAAGRELWKSDGTEGGTVLVRDVRPGAGSAVEPWAGPDTPALEAALGGVLYFVADDGVHGAELWKSDGTEVGTLLVKDVFPGPRGSDPIHLTRVRNRLYFVADDGIHGRELWVSDGTEGGTVLVADLVPGADSSLPQQLAAMGHVLLFSAWDATHGREPWKSDGTPAGTVLLDDVAPGAVSSSPVQFTSGFPNVYFGATDGVTGFEPWAFQREILGGTFADVPPDFWAFRWVEALADAGITGGCGAGGFCPDKAVSRAESAVFLVRAAHGEAFTPPPASGTLFADVPTGYWAAAWIEQLTADGVTGGCGGGNFCPESPVTRAELAVLLLRARFGSGFLPPLPPTTTGTVFLDVPESYWARDWIEHLVALGITAGCGNGNYCPERPVTRAEIAVFLTRAFELPTP